MAADTATEEFPLDTATESELQKLDKDVMVACILRFGKEKRKMVSHIESMQAALKGGEDSVTHLEKQSERVQHAHERELGLMFDESIAMRSEMEYKSTELVLENQRMKDEIGAYTVDTHPINERVSYRDTVRRCVCETAWHRLPHFRHLPLSDITSPPSHSLTCVCGGFRWWRSRIRCCGARWRRSRRRQRRSQRA